MAWREMASVQPQRSLRAVSRAGAVGSARQLCSGGRAIWASFFVSSEALFLKRSARSCCRMFSFSGWPVWHARARPDRDAIPRPGRRRRWAPVRCKVFQKWGLTPGRVWWGMPWPSQRDVQVNIVKWRHDLLQGCSSMT